MRFLHIPLPRPRMKRLAILLLALAFTASMANGSAAHGLSNSGMSPKNNLSTEATICKSIDIRNKLENFRALENCTVVEGFVQILLFDYVHESEFGALSFPLLTEITDYLLLYRVNGLRSVGQLFPNLAVIRGQTKMFDYALVIYEMANLQDIGLRALREISSGLVRVDKNPSLCYVNTVDWPTIALDQGEHFMKNIKPEVECPLCPDRAACPRCWNREHCQVVCPESCRNNCDARGECCDPLCIGCETGRPHKCLVCRNVVASNNACLAHCLQGYYMYLDRRCVTADECVHMPRPIAPSANTKSKQQHQDRNHKILESQDGRAKCVLECPADHTATEDHRCTKCQSGGCEKICPGVVIDSVSSAQELLGCTHINGSLEIQIRGGKNVVTELEKNLGSIEVIDGYLKIVRSFPLISLAFLKKLRHIRGNVLESNKHVFFVLDNQNLQDLWDWHNRTLRIDNGRLFFHFNPRLCLDKIRVLQQKTNLSEFANTEVAAESNGDKIACHISELNVTSSSRDHRAIVLKWDAFKIKDHRKLLGYIVYSVEAQHRNVTLFDGRDACGAEGWRVDDVPPTEGRITYLLTQLKPYTQYAVYVKTYTIASANAGAQSPIEYIRTRAGQPTIPIAMSYTSQDHKIHLKWNPPLSPNGKITHYIVTGGAIPTSLDVLQMRDFCSTKHKPTTPARYQPQQPSFVDTNATCECDDGQGATKGGVHKNASTVEDQIKFEDLLYDFVYIKREVSPQHLRKTRSIPDYRVLEKRDAYNESSSSNAIGKEAEDDVALAEIKRNSVVTEKRPEAYNHTDELGRLTEFRVLVNSTDVFIENLKHFTQYYVYVQACRELEFSDDNNTCSETATQTIKTERKDDVDVITSVQITNITTDSAVVSWEGPLDPNGYVESFHITYGNVDDNDPHNQTQCVSVEPTFSTNVRHSYKLVRLKPGNWSLQISVTSQAGTGNPTDTLYFYVKHPVNVTWYVLLILAVVLAAMGLAAYRFRARCQRHDLEKLVPSVNPDYISTTYVPDDWEVPRDKIELLKELGQGSFGMVYEGLMNDGKNTHKRCAVKTVNEHATDRERHEFLNEASVMKAFDTTHVVRLLGVVSQGQPTLVIMELMANGDLKTYLRSHRPDSECFDAIERKPPNLKQILQMAIEIADGMAYLAAKKFVHRDVAARNCMVSDQLVVKIGDFGMTRDIYETDYYRKGSKGLLPVRWMAPESLKDGVFTSRSDVWSYGVVLWEMATLASQPYQGLTNDQVLHYVIRGNIMERPEKCPDIMYDLMKRCWNRKPSDRPTFLKLCEILLDDARSDFKAVSFYHSPAGVEARNQRLQRNASQDDVTIPLRADEDDKESDAEEDAAEDDGGGDGVADVESGGGGGGGANIKFISYPSMTNLSSTANGYVTASRPSNGPNV